jgi:hypothetical protein
MFSYLYLFELRNVSGTYITDGEEKRLFKRRHGAWCQTSSGAMANAPAVVWFY